MELDGEAVRPVGAAVVDEDDLPLAVDLVEDACKPLGQERQDLLLVPQRDDDGKTGGGALHRDETSEAPRRLPRVRPLAESLPGLAVSRPRLSPR